MAFYFRNTNKKFIMTEDDEQQYRKTIICRIFEKNKGLEKISDHCHSIRKNGRSAHNKCTNNVTHNQLYYSNFIS